MKKIILTLFFTIATLWCNSQNMYYFGIDFSKNLYVNSEGFSDTNKIREHYLNEINATVNEEIFDLLSLKLSVPNVHHQIFISNLEYSSIRNKNSKIRIVSTAPDTVQYNVLVNSYIDYYKQKINNETWFGCLIVSVSLNKYRPKYDESYSKSLFIVFNNEGTILFNMYITDLAGGLGFVNYWAKSFEKSIGGMRIKKSSKIWLRK